MRQTIPDFQSPSMHDELKHSIRHALMEDVSTQTLSVPEMKAAVLSMADA